MPLKDYKTITDLKLEFEDGLENPSGIEELAYLVPVSSIATEARPVANGTTAAGIVTIATSHVLKAGKSALRVTPLYSKSGAMFKLSGEELSKVFETDVEFFVPQISAATVGGAVAMKNMRFLIFVRRPGQLTGFWQIGSLGMSAKVQDMPGGFATGPNGEVGIKIVLKAFDFTPMYEYTAELPVPAP
jgi:hypothetical protein